jgi:hypothetical protein
LRVGKALGWWVQMDEWWSGPDGVAKEDEEQMCVDCASFNIVV